MNMAREPAAELWVRVQSNGSLVRVQSEPLVPRRDDDSSGDLRSWVDKSDMPWSAMVLGGMGLGTLGMLLATVNPLGFLGVVAFSSMITLGGGLTFLGLMKRRRAQSQGALPPARTPQGRTDPTVLAERMRRVRSVIGNRDWTFEGLMGQLRWTEAALVETLLEMKQRGVIEEDLDLDSGQWVYRAQVPEGSGSGRPPTLEERQLVPGGENA